MKFDFIDNSAPNETERTETNKMFVDFVKSAVDNVAIKDLETENCSLKTKELEVKIEDLTITIGERLFKAKMEPFFEDTTYEIRLNKSLFSHSGITIYNETYKYSESDSSKDFVKRTTGHMSMDEMNTNDTTETHEVGKEEMAKMLDFVKRKLENH